ncbi:MAG TPA: hypothetical protein VFF30_00325 [Nitrososphaerales archaeon]|nr:hypothetical protein [Nitrososphaerales archaeon]
MNSVEPIRLSDIDQIEGTRVFCGSTDNIFKLVEETTSRAAADIEDPCSNFVCDKFGLKLALSALKFREKFRKEIQLKHPNYKVRLLVDIQNENLEFVKQLLLVSEPQLEVRHLEGIKANFYVTRKDFVCYPLSLEVGDPQELIWSTSPMTIAQMLNVFQYLWNSGVAAEYRIKQLEQNREVGEVNLLTNPSEIRQKYIGLAESSNSEVLIAAVSERSVLRNREDIALLSRRAERENITPSEDREDIKREKLRMRILIPSEDSSSGSMIKEMLGEFEYRKIESIPISFGVFDRERGFAYSIRSRRNGRRCEGRAGNFFCHTHYEQTDGIWSCLGVRRAVAAE